MTSSTSKIDQTTFRQQNDVITVWEKETINLKFKTFNLDRLANMAYHLDDLIWHCKILTWGLMLIFSTALSVNHLTSISQSK